MQCRLTKLDSNCTALLRNSKQQEGQTGPVQAVPRNNTVLRATVQVANELTC